MRTVTTIFERKLSPYTGSASGWFRANRDSNTADETAKFLPECKAKFGRPQRFRR